LAMPRAPRARKGSIPESLSTNNRLLSEKSDQRRLRLHESESVSRVSDGVIPRFPTLLDHLFTAWCWALVVFIFAKISWCAPRSEVSRSTNIPRRLRQRLLLAELREQTSGRWLEDRQIVYRQSGGRRSERRYRALDRGLCEHARPRGYRLGSGERPAGGGFDGHEVQSGPGHLLFEAARRRGSGEVQSD
jgi:hypothetical protein